MNFKFIEPTRLFLKKWVSYKLDVHEMAHCCIRLVRHLAGTLFPRRPDVFYCLSSTQQGQCLTMMDYC